MMERAPTMGKDTGLNQTLLFSARVTPGQLPPLSLSLSLSAPLCLPPSKRKHSRSDLTVPSLLLSYCSASPSQLPWSRLVNYLPAHTSASAGKDMLLPFKGMTHSCAHHFYSWPPSSFLARPHFVRGNLSIPPTTQSMAPSLPFPGLSQPL